MELRTKIEVPRLGLDIDHTKYGLMLGSCFAESIADHMMAAKFNLVKNPFGVIYNPYSIADSIIRLESAREFGPEELLTCGDLWFSLAHHGSFSSVDCCQTLENINSRFTEGAVALAKVDYVVITFGTAWIYTNVQSGAVVANCHKLPSKEFVRSRLSVEQIVALYEPLLCGALAGKQVIFTVSPIRHIKDGLAENSISKATLLVAIDELRRRYNNVYYFPSYEIMIDELRDYRFYKEDMLHPTAQAIDYIWTLFCQATMLSNTRQLMQAIEQIVRAVNHRPLNPCSKSHAKFRSSMLMQIAELARQHPDIDFSSELNFFHKDDEQ